ncbi:MAG: hypothetical protein R3F56_02155 [Planctomycetota bacterium]
MFCLSALVYYHTAMGGTGEAWGFFQGAVVALYRWLGFVPTFMFWLLLFVWCSIWFVTGHWEGARTRLTWMVGFTLCIAILVNLGTPTDPLPPHAGIVGTFVAVRLTSVIGYALAALLAVAAALASLLLATDFLFYRYFEAMARGRVGDDVGVEPEATDAFRELAFSGVYADAPRAVAEPGVAPAEQEADEVAVAARESDGGGGVATVSIDDVDQEIVVRPRWRRRGRPSRESAADTDADQTAGSLAPDVAEPVALDAHAVAMADMATDESAGDREASHLEDTEVEDSEVEDSEVEDDDLEDDDLEDVGGAAGRDAATDEYVTDDDDDDLEHVHHDDVERDESVDLRSDAAAQEDDVDETMPRADEFDLDAGDEESGDERSDTPSRSDEADAEEPDTSEPVVAIPRGRPWRHGSSRQDASRQASSKQGELFADSAAADDLDRAAREVMSAGRASLTLLRRHLGCSASEALQLLDALRDAGVVDGEPGAPHGRVVTTLAEWEAR